MPFSSEAPPWIRIGLELLVLLLLLTNGVILVYAWRLRGQVMALRATVSTMLQRAIGDLQGFERLSMHFTVRVSDKIPVRATLPVRDTLQVAVQTQVPIRQTLHADAMINTPLLNTKVPVSIAVPIDMSVPVDMAVPVAVDARIPVHLDIPVKLDVPVALELGETELGEFIEQVRSGLEALRDLLDQTALPGE